MMATKVIKIFVLKEYSDAITHEMREAGKIYNYSDKNRVQVLVKGGHVRVASKEDIEAAEKD